MLGSCWGNCGIDWQVLADQASGSQSTCNNDFVVKVLSRKCAAIKRMELFAVGGASSPGRKEVLFAQAIGQLGHAYYHGARSSSVTASVLAYVCS